MKLLNVINMSPPALQGSRWSWSAPCLPAEGRLGPGQEDCVRPSVHTCTTSLGHWTENDSQSRAGGGLQSHTVEALAWG